MSRRRAILLALVAMVSALHADNDWPRWRGPRDNGIAPDSNPPVTWSETANIKWKTAIPGFGLSTPIITNGKVFLLTSVPMKKDVDLSDLEAKKSQLPDWRRPRSRMTKSVHTFRVLCIDQKSGKILWDKTMREEVPNEPIHRDGSWAPHSPVTDGTQLWALFGSHGLYCLDLDGNLIWQKDLGRMTTKARFGEGSSPTLYKDKLIINWDHENDSFLYVLDKATGKEIWKKARNEGTSWSTPVVVDVHGKPQIIVAATGNSCGYELETGGVIWDLGALTGNVIPTPIHVDGRLYLTSGFRGAAMQCIDLARAQGDLADSDAVLWTADKHTPYVPTPVCYDGIIYYTKVNDSDILARDATSGKLLYGPQPIDGMKHIYASLTAADNKIYVTGRNGTTVVLKPGKTYNVLSVNKVDDKVDASPAFSGNQLFLRGHRHLYCIENTKLK